jgi:hypothetical protein
LPAILKALQELGRDADLPGLPSETVDAEWEELD